MMMGGRLEANAEEDLFKVAQFVMVSMAVQCVVCVYVFRTFLDQSLWPRIQQR